MPEPSATPPIATNAYARQLMILFGLVYFVQGVGQRTGLIAQPLQFFFKETVGLDAAQSTEFLAVLTIPWTIKPLYGLLSDFIPLFGYRRKTWLVLTNGLAALGFLWLTGLTTPGAVVLALVLTSLGTAASDVIVDAIMVESGKSTGLTAQFQSVQWLWISIASIISALVGGWLCTAFDPGTALHVAALVALFAPLTAVVASWLIVREERSAIDRAQVTATTAGLNEAFHSRTLWAAIGFLAFWYLSPSFGTPWYYHQTDTLEFSQGFIGTLSAWEAVGGVLGALTYWRHFAEQPIRQQLLFGIWSGTIGTLLYVLLLKPTDASHAIAVALALGTGTTNMIASLAILTLAARACPAKAEGFTFAALMSVINGVTQLSAIIGARLYTDVFKSMLPLILISAAFTLACIVLLPILQPAQSDDNRLTGS